MKNSNILLFLILSACLYSCGKKEKPAEPLTVADSVASPATAEFRTVKIDARTLGPEKSPEQLQIEEAIVKMEENINDPVVGYWVGAFGRNKINVAIAGIEAGKAIGYTVCAGNYRPIKGEVKIQGDTLFTFDMNEPGTDQYDGHFQFTINTRQMVMEGAWSPFRKGAASSKKYSLKKTTYTYFTYVGDYPEASDRLLTEEDVSNMLPEELEVVRNEIYARHGYSFKNKDMRLRFDTTSWYIPMGVDIRDNLTDIEVQNIDLLYQYEEYYAENYDDYGR